MGRVVEVKKSPLSNPKVASGCVARCSHSAHAHPTHMWTCTTVLQSAQPLLHEARLRKQEEKNEAKKAQRKKKSGELQQLARANTPRDCYEILQAHSTHAHLR